jgi:hypothetical protein
MSNYITNNKPLTEIFQSGTNPDIVTNYKTNINGIDTDLSQIFAKNTNEIFVDNTGFICNINNADIDLSRLFQRKDPFTFTSGSSSNYIASSIIRDNVVYYGYYFDTGTFNFTNNYPIDLYQVWCVATGGRGENGLSASSSVDFDGGNGGEIKIIGSNTSVSVTCTIVTGSTFTLNVNNVNGTDSSGTIPVAGSYTAKTAGGASGGTKGNNGSDGRPNFYNGLYYGGGGGGGVGNNIGGNGTNGGLGGGGGGGSAIGSNYTGGNGGGISASLVGGRGGNTTAGENSRFGGGGGGSANLFSATNGGNGGPNGGGYGGQAIISSGGNNTGGGGGGVGTGGGGGCVGVPQSVIGIGASSVGGGGGGSGITILIFRPTN